MGVKFDTSRIQIEAGNAEHIMVNVRIGSIKQRHVVTGPRETIELLAVSEASHGRIFGLREFEPLDHFHRGGIQDRHLVAKLVKILSVGGGFKSKTPKKSGVAGQVLFFNLHRLYDLLRGDVDHRILRPADVKMVRLFVDLGRHA